MTHTIWLQQCLEITCILHYSPYTEELPVFEAFRKKERGPFIQFENFSVIVYMNVGLFLKAIRRENKTS